MLNERRLMLVELRGTVGGAVFQSARQVSLSSTDCSLQQLVDSIMFRIESEKSSIPLYFWIKNMILLWST